MGGSLQKVLSIVKEKWVENSMGLEKFMDSSMEGPLNANC